MSMQKTQHRKPAAKGSRPAHQVRIIGGQWKRTPLPVLDAEGLRPTPDRVRETVFNWLNHLLDGAWQDVACLDLFAGTGALGFEAASRGAKRVLMVEAGGQAIRQLEATRVKLNAAQVDIVRGDALLTAQGMTAPEYSENTRFDVIFLDPPYHQDWLAKTLPLCKRLLAEGGLVYAESEKPLDADSAAEWMSGWNIVRADKAGMVFYQLLQRNTETQIQA